MLFQQGNAVRVAVVGEKKLVDDQGAELFGAFVEHHVVAQCRAGKAGRVLAGDGKIRLLKGHRQ